MTRRILFVDDEPRILSALERQLSGTFEVRTAVGPEAGLRVLCEDGPYAVVVSDFRMPVMDGIQFLAKVKEANRETVRVMLTGQADLNTAILAVNEGNIFRFLTKPCAAEQLTMALNAALEQHRLITTERELLERTLRGSIQVLSEVLSMASPAAFRRGCAIRKYVSHMANTLAVPNVWECELAAMLCQVGCITLPQLVLDKVASRERLSDDEEEAYAAHPGVARRLLEHIPRLESVARMIGEQNDRRELDELDEEADSTELGAAILRAALEFDRRVSAGESSFSALASMRAAGMDDPRLLEALSSVEVQNTERSVCMLRVHELVVGMAINQDVRTKDGMLLLRKGEELTQAMVECLRSFARTYGIPQPLSVLVPRGSV
jgi:CheY-like chemotaxis protein